MKRIAHPQRMPWIWIKHELARSDNHNVLIKISNFHLLRSIHIPITERNPAPQAIAALEADAFLSNDTFFRRAMARVLRGWRARLLNMAPLLCLQDWGLVESCWERSRLDHSIQVETADEL